MYDAITSLVYHPNSTRHASLGILSPQYSNTLCHKTYSGLLLYSSCYTFCGMVIHTAFLLLGQSLHWCPSPSYSKYFIFLSCTFLHIEWAGSFNCFTCCGMATLATHSSLFFSTSCLLISPHTLSPYLTILQIYFEELTFPSFLLFYSNYGLGTWTFCSSNIVFLSFLLSLPLMKQGHTFIWASCS